MDERIKEKVASMTFMSDPLFKEAAKDKEFCQEFLRTLYGDLELIVIENNPSFKINNLYGKEVELDALCITGDGRYINIEVQNVNSDNIFKRARYNASILTSNIEPKGDLYRNVPNVCIIFITKFDPFKDNLIIYHVDHVVRETGEKVNDGLEEIFVNTRVNDGSKIAKLMRIFSTTSEYNDELFPKISETKRFFKTNLKGEKKMCEVTKEIYEMGLRDGERNNREVYEEGIEEGIREGKKRGREEGKKKTLLTSIKNLMDSLKITAEKAMDALKIKEEDREMYLKALQK